MVSLNKKVRASVSVCLSSSRASRGGVLSFFATGACAGAVFFFPLLICLNSDPTWEEELRGLFCLSVCLFVCLSEINRYL
jgi:hypothetical protein